MISEDWRSRTLRDTMDGVVIERRLTCRWSDWDRQSGTREWADNSTTDDWEFPQVGDEWIGNANVRVSERRVEGIDNENCQVVITYSSDAGIQYTFRPDDPSSWEATIDFGMEEVTVDGYIDVVTEQYVDWATKWKEEGPGGATVDNAPELSHMVARASIDMTLYGSTMLYGNFFPYLGKVNSEDLLSQWQNKYQRMRLERKFGGAFEDKGKWYLMGFRYRLIREGVFEYILRFLFDADGWNVQYGIEVSQYITIDFGDLLGLFDVDNEGDNVALSETWAVTNLRAEF